MKRLYMAVLALAVLTCNVAFGEVIGVYPISLRDTDKVVVKEMPGFDKAAMLREDSLSQLEKIGGLRFAKRFDVDYGPENSGTVTKRNDGSQRWRIGLRSKGALSINLIFSKFHLGEGDTLYIYNADTTSVIGPLTRRTNLLSGVLPTTDIAGDEVFVDYRRSAVKDTCRALRVGAVNHDYRGLRIGPKTISATADTCSVHASCDDKISQIKQAVCLLVVGGSYYCSGTMVNNTAKDGKPYLISAAHCFSESSATVAETEATKNAAETVVYFNYEAPECDAAIRGSQEFYIAGTTLKAFAQDLDLGLVELSSMPPADFRAYYAGWNLESLPAPPYKCIHQPWGTVKRVATEKDYISEGTINVSGSYSLASNAHWRVSRWDVGTTDSGSSGSALFDANGLIVGCLTGGSSTCAKPVDDYFYRLNKAWDFYTDSSKQLKAWLDPSGSGATTLEGMNPYGSDSAARLSNITKADSPSKTYISAGGLTTGQNSEGATEYAEGFSLGRNAYLLGFYLMPYTSAFTGSVKVYGDTLNDEPLAVYELSTPVMLQWNKTTSVFYTTGKAATKDNENYIRLGSKLAVGKKFYLSYTVSYGNLPADSFGIYSAAGASRTNTAYCLLGSTWTPIGSAYGTDNGSLWIDPVLVYNDSANVTDTSLIQRTESTTTLYPNPVNPNSEELHISTRIVNETKCKVELFSVNGMKAKSLTGTVCKTDIAMDVSDLADGVYIVRITYADKVENQKLIIARE